MINKILSFTGLAFLLIGILLISYSLTLEKFTDETAYNERYMAIDSSLSTASTEFAALRDEYLTPKFMVENYGLTTLILGVIILILSAMGYKRVKTPSNRIWLVLVGVFSSVLICLAYVGDLFLEMYRGSYPHWADSLGIPLMSVPLILFIFLIWTGIILIWIKSPFISGVALLPLNLRNSDKFLLIVLLLTIILLLYILVTGYFWMIIPCAFWMYFYMSIIQGKNQAKQDNK